MSRAESRPLPRATPQMAQRVWESQRRPSARTVARALTQAGMPVHYVTVNRWRSEGWREIEHGEHPLDAASACLDTAVPVLTGDPMCKAQDFVTPEARQELDQSTDKELLEAAAREALVTEVLLHREIQRQIQTLLATRPTEIGVLIRALAASHEAAIGALGQADAVRQTEFRSSRQLPEEFRIRLRENLREARAMVQENWP